VAGNRRRSNWPSHEYVATPSRRSRSNCRWSRPAVRPWIRRK
jgi:hypothetical protein